MKFLALSVLCLASLQAQTAPPQTRTPVLPDLPDAASVASCEDGHVITMAEMRGVLLAVDNPQASANVREFLNQWCMMRKLARLARDEKLDQESPTREQLLWSQNYVLAQAEISHVANPIVPGEEEKAYYDEHKSQYQQVKTYAIYIAFSNAAASQTAGDGKKILSEPEAKAKAEALLEQIRKGADFRKLAKANSDDETSRDKDGFFNDLKPTDPMPDSIRTAIFSLKKGETTDVIPQPNGFYIFRAEDVTYKPFEEVRDQVDRALKHERADQWMRTIQAETKAAILTDKIK
jgi:parvulin-like peptidyl-prolyl isomerase